MPTYTYRCTACQQEATLQQSIKASKTQVCEACGGIARPVVLSSPTVLNSAPNIQELLQTVETTQQEDSPPDSACCFHTHEH